MSKSADHLILPFEWDLLLKTKLNKNEIRTRKDLVYNLLLKRYFKNPNFTDLTNDLVNHLFHVLDDFHFGGAISRYIKSNSIQFFTGVSDRMTQSAGVCKKKSKNNYEILISRPIFKKIFAGNIKVLKSGNKCVSRLDCLIRVYEHELIHLIINLLSTDEDKRLAHGAKFKKLARDIFGHNEFTHHLTEEDYIVKKNRSKEMKSKIKIGNYIKAKKDKKCISGVVVSLSTKTVTIVTANNQFFSIPYHSIGEISSTPFEGGTNQPSLNLNRPKVGQYISLSGLTAKKNKSNRIDSYGIVTKLNVNTFTVSSDSGAKYRIRYGAPYKILSKKDILSKKIPIKQFESLIQSKPMPHSFKNGDNVSFFFQGKTISGKIIRLNPKTVSVMVSGSKGEENKYLVPYHELRK